jgi:hypothetical protein
VRAVEEKDMLKRTAGTALEAHHEVDIEVEAVGRLEGVEQVEDEVANAQMSRNLRKWTPHRQYLVPHRPNLLCLLLLLNLSRLDHNSKILQISQKQQSPKAC